MNEEEWLACTDPDEMLAFVRGKVSDRQLRLFAVACCRHIWPLLTDERSRTAVQVAEQYADAQATADDLDAVSQLAWSVSRYSLGRPAAAAEAAAEATWGDGDFDGLYHVALLTYNAFYAMGEAESTRIAQCRLLKEVFGNPFRPVAVEPSWLTPTVVSLAQTIYDDRAFDRMPILGDCLEEVGCTNPDVLTHCRGPGPHVRGCWLVDLLLGKS